MSKLLLAVLLSATMQDPSADPHAIVRAGDARFTVLTPQLIRMEWSAGAAFEDRASLVFINRKVDVPHFIAKQSGGWQTIETDRLLLRYKLSGGKF